MARFGRALRQRNVEIGLGDETDSLEALQLIDIGDADDVYYALRTALKIDRRHWGTFDLLFDRMWRRGDRELDHDPFPGSDAISERPAFELRRSGPAPPDSVDATPEGDTAAGYSPEARLRTKTFDECTPQDLAAMQHLLDRLARRLATPTSHHSRTK